MNWAQSTVSALAYSFARERSGGDPALLAPPYNDVARFVDFELSEMPDFLRPPMRLLLLAFDLCGLPRAGALFHRQPHERRWEQILAWKASRWGVLRDFIRFYESLCVFALHDRGA